MQSVAVYKPIPSDSDSVRTEVLTADSSRDVYDPDLTSLLLVGRHATVPVVDSGQWTEDSEHWMRTEDSG